MNDFWKPIVDNTICHNNSYSYSGDKDSPLICLFRCLPRGIYPKYLRYERGDESVFWIFHAREEKSEEGKACKAYLHNDIEHECAKKRIMNFVFVSVIARNEAIQLFN